MSSTPHTAHRDNCINLLRFLFSLTVVVHHWIDVTMVPLPVWLMTTQSMMTSLAILGFFILSGYLIHQSYDRSRSLADYFQKRARRILPPYLLVVLLCAFGLVAVSSLPAADYFRSPDWWKYLVSNLFFLNFLHPTLPGVFDSPLVNDASVNPALWTLKIEVAFYLVLPLIAWLLHRIRHRGACLLTLYALSIAYVLLLHHYADLLGSKADTLEHQLPGMLCYFLTGMLIYTYRDAFLRLKHYLVLPAVAVYGLEEYFSVVLFSPLALGVVVLWAAFSLKQLDSLVRWGDVSYGMYVYHAPILKVMAVGGLFAAWPAYCAVPLYVAIVFLLSFASWHLMEKTILKRK